MIVSAGAMGILGGNGQQTHRGSMANTRRKRKTTSRPTRLARILGYVRRRVWRVGLLVVGLMAIWVAAYSVFPVPTTAYILSERIRLGSVERDWTPIDDISENLQRAVVAAEDANFCLHWGFDMAAIRAAIDAGAARGGSTISQQTVKNAFLWHGRSWLRKALEAAITPVMEAIWTKRRILEVYLNVAEFDEGVFGAQAAARTISALRRRPEPGTGRAPRRRPARAAGPPRPAVRANSCATVRGDPRRRRHDPRRRARRLLCELNFQPVFGIKTSNPVKDPTRHDPPLPLRALPVLPQGPPGPGRKEDRRRTGRREILGTLDRVPAPQPGRKGPDPEDRRPDADRKQCDLRIYRGNASRARPDARRPPRPAEVRRLVHWFDDKFHHEVTKNLVYERVNKKVMRAGYPDGKAVKAGATAIKYHLRYMEWLLDHRRWLAGDRMTMADFAAAAHISCLDYISDVDWTVQPAGQGLVRDPEIAPRLPLDPVRSRARLRAAAALREPGLLSGLKARLPPRRARRDSRRSASVDPMPSRRRPERLAAFVDRGYHGQMGWMAERMAWRGDPTALWPEARSVIMLAEAYTPRTKTRSPISTRPKPRRSASMPATATITRPGQETAETGGAVVAARSGR
jgi:monofunctional biosynthetic peptidoglycan transglycosylase